MDLRPVSIHLATFDDPDSNDHQKKAISFGSPTPPQLGSITGLYVLN
jgi:hypothetical protein